MAEMTPVHPAFVKETNERIADLQRQLAEAKGRGEAWMETAAQESRNRDYYRGLVEKIGALFGVEARTADDGTIYEDVVVAKVPDLVAQKLAEAQREREKFKKQGDKRRCDSCLEVHPMDTICPPYEVRTTGQAWFRERWGHLMKERAQDQAAILGLNTALDVAIENQGMCEVQCDHAACALIHNTRIKHAPAIARATA